MAILAPSQSKEVLYELEGFLSFGDDSDHDGRRGGATDLCLGGKWQRRESLHAIVLSAALGIAHGVFAHNFLVPSGREMIGKAFAHDEDRFGTQFS